MSRKIVHGVVIALFAGLMNAEIARAGDKRDIVDTAVSAGSFGTLATALKAADLIDVLKGPGPFTVFAPTDEAFAKLPKGALDNLLKNKDQLRAVLTLHVVAGKVMAADVVKLTSAKTLLGQVLPIDASHGVRVGAATITKTDIACSNGVIHVIDTVLLPKNDVIETARNAGSFKTLLTAIEAAGLTDTLRSDGPFTVFAPTDDAFATLPKGALDNLLKDKKRLAGVLTYHVVAGKALAKDVVKLKEAKTVQGGSVKIDTTSGVMIDNARVIKPDVAATNGVIHVIDSVLLPADVKLGAANNQVESSIRLAIERGVPLFNSGNMEACAAVYEVTTVAVLNLAGHELDAGSRARLERGLREVGQSHGASDGAWALRHAFDDVLASEREMMQPVASR